MIITRQYVLILTFLGCSLCLQAQDTSNVYFTTAVGVLSPLLSFSKAYKKSLALNSGIEYRFSKHYFTQLVLDFNAINYNQQVKDGSSAYLFQNTSSSVFLVGLNLGKNISITKSGSLFLSPYVGFGYANIGEPRLSLNTSSGIINQDVTRMKGFFTRGGLRLGYNTKSKFLQTLYVDASYWSANITVQNSKPQALSFLVGTRIGL